MVVECHGRERDSIQVNGEMNWWVAGSLLAQTADVMRWAWPIGVALAGGALVATGSAALSQRRLPPLRLAWLALLVFNPVAMVTVAGLSTHGGPFTAGSGWPVRAAGALLVLQCLLALWTTWRAGPWRASVGALHALLMWPALCTALIVASMS